MTRRIHIEMTLRDGRQQTCVLDIPAGSSTSDGLIRPMQVLCDRILIVILIPKVAAEAHNISRKFRLLDFDDDLLIGLIRFFDCGCEIKTVDG
ncbi:MAG: hypothetical protein GY801_35155 [bacterium]|nr:hypothetical protein [bacterium]